MTKGLNKKIVHASIIRCGAPPVGSTRLIQGLLGPARKHRSTSTRQAGLAPLTGRAMDRLWSVSAPLERNSSNSQPSCASLRFTGRGAGSSGGSAEACAFCAWVWRLRRSYFPLDGLSIRHWGGCCSLVPSYLPEMYLILKAGKIIPASRRARAVRRRMKPEKARVPSLGLASQTGKRAGRSLR